MTVDLGDFARDIVTGFQGVIIGHARYLTGCDQYAINPGLDKDGKSQPSEWYDVNRLEVVKGKTKIVLDTDKTKGGPNRDAPTSTRRV